MTAEPEPVQRAFAAKSKGRTHAAAEQERKERQSDLLDEALLETFPASDPVSVARVR